METDLNNLELKAPLAQSIKIAYNKLAAVLNQVPAKDRDLKTINGTGGLISVSDITAYQIGWGKLLVSWYQAGIKNTTPLMPGEGFTTWFYTGLAQHFYAKYDYDNTIKQEKELYDLVKEIIMLVEYEYQAGNLDKLGVWQWCTLKSGKQWPLSKWVTINTVAPYKKARLLLSKFLKNL